MSEMASRSLVPGCIFSNVYHCKREEKCVKNQNKERLKTISDFSKQHQDGLHKELEKALTSDIECDVFYHKNCISRYISKSNSPIKEESVEPPRKRLRSLQEKAFDFKLHCLFCGDDCNLSRDPRHPGRWREAYKCRKTVSSSDERPYKEYIQELCFERNDKWGEEVQFRLNGTLSDITAIGAKYHKDCLSRFLTSTKRKACTPKKAGAENVDEERLRRVIQTMQSDKEKVWDTTEIHAMYEQNATHTISRRSLIESLKQQLSDDIALFSSPGHPGLVIFQNQIAKKLRYKEEDDLQHHLEKVARKIKAESKAVEMDRGSYAIDLDRKNAMYSSSDSLQKLLTAISSKFTYSLQAIMIGNIITSIVRNQPTDLQVALSVLLQNSKSLINTFHDYGVTCSYDEMHRFKKSAALTALTNVDSCGLESRNEGLIQVVVDNFDADIASQNGKKSTHSLAMIITQSGQEDDMLHSNTATRIPRQSHADSRLPIEDQMEVVSYIPKEKKPQMPPRNADDRNVEYDPTEAEESDFQFLQDVLTKADCPEFNGYNVQKQREAGVNKSSKTNLSYMPMIDNPPSSPATMMTAMLKAKEMCDKLGQTFVVLTADLQLYKVAVHLKWENRELFKNVHLRMGGMHLLMNYVGAIGNLMAGSGLEEVLSAAFSGVAKMLSGKKFPQNVRALRLLVEEILRPIFKAHPQLTTMEELKQLLNEKCKESKTSKLWVTVVIYPILNIMKFVRAERESNWLLHLSSVKEMIPLFFAAGHPNYARYTQVYMQEMEDLPDEVGNHFLNGEHTFHHNDGWFNGIWTDMAIESTYMRYGHGHSGIIGVTLNEEAVRTWAYSMHACSRVVSSLEEMRNCQSQPSSHHKEEGAGRIKSDAEDRQALRNQLNLCIHPLREDDENTYQSQYLVNIATGEVVHHASVNVAESYALGAQEMVKFQSRCPQGFHEPIKKLVIGMDVSKKHIRIEDSRIIDPEVVYGRAMAIQSASRPFNPKMLLSYELAPFPTAMFTSKGMRTTDKSVLKNKLKVEVNDEVQYDAIFIDGCSMLWTIPWPTGKRVSDFLWTFFRRLQDLIERCPTAVYLIFDW